MSAYVIVCCAMQLLPLTALRGLPGLSRDRDSGRISPLVLYNPPSMRQLYIKSPRLSKTQTKNATEDDSISSLATDDGNDIN
jgi:hypothetical protein